MMELPKPVSKFSAVYTRQSIEKEDSLSISTQIDFAEKLCGQEIRYYSDPGYSRSNLNRPGLKRLLDDVRAGEIDKIVVYRLDRLTRSLFDLLDLWRLLEERHVAFVSATEPFDTSTALGKMLLMILTMIAEWERDNTIKRVTDNYYKRAQLGHWVGGRAPYGYDYSSFHCQGREIKSLEVNWERLNQEKRIREMYLDPNVSLGMIKKRLNDEGVKTAAGVNWSVATVSRVMRNPSAVRATPAIYAFFKGLGTQITSPVEQFNGEYGCLLVGKRGGSTRQRKKMEEAKLSVGSWAAYIEPDVYLKNMERLQTNTRLGRNGTGLNTWLAGIIRCPYCKMSMAVKHYTDRFDVKRSYVWCNGRNTGICDYRSKMKIHAIEEALGVEIQKLLDEATPQEIAPHVSPEEIEIQMQLVNLEEKIKQAIDMIFNKNVSDITVKYINKELESLNKRKERLEEELGSTLHKKAAAYIPEKLEFDSLSFDEKKSIAKTYLGKVYVYDNYIETIWNV